MKKRPTGLSYKSKYVDYTEEQMKEVKRLQNQKYYQKKKEQLEEYKKILNEKST